MTDMQIWSVETDAPLQSFLEWPECPQVIQDSVTGVMSWQRRNEVSIGRALRSPRIAPQWVAALLAWGGTVSVEDGVESEMAAVEIPLADALSQKLAGKIRQLHVPLVAADPSWERRWGEAHVARTLADERIVSVTAVADVAGGIIQAARVALTGVWELPVALVAAAHILPGMSLSDADFAAVAAAVQQEISPRGDLLGSAEYRRAMAGVLTRRALEACREVR